MSKVIVLGAPLTGKTSLTHALREQVEISVLDFDEELLKLNNGRYPANYPVLNKQLKDRVIENVSTMKEVIFFAFEIEIEALRRLEQDNFMIVQLTAPLEVLKARNQERLKNDPDNDAFQYVTKNLEYQNKVKELGLVDLIIDTSTEGLNDSLKSIIQMSLTSK